MSSRSVLAESSVPVAVERLLAEHGVNDAGRALVRSVREGQPARLVSGRAGNSTGRYPSRKMGCTIQYESRTVEFAFVICCETDDAVVEYFDQPCSLALDYPGRGEHRVVVSHTPDFIVFGDEFVGFIECKPEDKLRKLSERSPGRYVADGDRRWRCPPGEAAAERYGLGYRVWTPAGVTPALIDNSRFLEAQWGGGRSAVAADDLDRVLSSVRARPGVSLEELVHDLGDPDLVHLCILQRHVYVDLAAQFLSQPDRIRVFLDQAAAAAWSAALASVDRSEGSAAQTLARATLAKYPPESWSVALERYRTIQHAIEAALPTRALVGPGSHSRRRWLSDFRRAKREGGVGLVGLCPKTHQQGNFLPRFPSETYEILEKVAAEEYDTNKNATVQVVHATALDRCADAGVPCVSYDSFRKFLKRRDPAVTVARRKGRKAAAAAAPAFGPRDPAVAGQGPLDVVHIDHTLLDVFVQVGPDPDGVPQRLWLTVAICAWSRSILGYDLSFDAPAVGGLLTTMRDLFRRHERIPNRVVVDRGPEFGSRAFEELCAACEINKLDRPSGRPKFGAVIERMFDTVNTQLVHVLSGNTQLLQNPRGMSREVDPRRDVIWRLPELDDALRRFLFDVYPCQPHRGLDGMTPRARFEQGVRMVGAGRPLPETSDIRFLLWPPSRRGTATVDSRTGIVVDCVRYWHADMRSERFRKKKVPVRVDPYDLRHVVAFLDGRWVLCLADCAAELAGHSRRELRLASLELARRRRGSGRRQAVRTRHLVAMLRELRETEQGLRQARRDAERRAVLEKRHLHLVSEPQSPAEERAGAQEPDWTPPAFDDIGSGTPL